MFLMNQVPIWKIVTVVLALLFAFWLLIPSFQYYSLPDEDQRSSPAMRAAAEEENQLNVEVEVLLDEIEQARKNESYDSLEDLKKQVNELKTKLVAASDRFKEARGEHDNLRAKIIKLGLDLQGGVHVVLEVDRESVIKNNDNDGDGEPDIPIDQAMRNALDSTRTVVEERVNKTGVSEPVIQVQPPNRIIVEIPGIERPEQVAGLLQTQAQLSFHLLADVEDAHDIIEDLDSRTAADLSSMLLEQRGDRSSAFTVSAANVRAVSAAIHSSVAQAVIPSDYTFRWSGEEQKPEMGAIRQLYLIRSRAEITGALLRNAYMDVDSMNFNEPMVYLFFNNRGQNIFERVTEANVGQRLAIILDDRVYSAPVIKGRIPAGSPATITGISDQQEANQLSIVLRAGALPAKVKIAENRVVGPSLGQDSINQGIRSAFVGVVIVAFFMVVYYAWAGAVADLALILNFIFVLAALAFFKATLTLPGVAGAVLIVGMAVDANVLIFERIREELSNQRSKTLKAVVDKGYNRAFLTIFDSNVTTLLTAIVLFQFGTGPIRGFAVTLMLGILISMFTALFVTRIVFDMALRTGKYKSLSVGKFRVLQNPDWNLVDQAKIPLTISGGIVALGLIMAVVHGGLNAGIDFSGGSLVRVEFSEPTDEGKIRQILQDAGHPDGLIIQRVSDAEISGTEFHIKTKLDPNASEESQGEAVTIIEDLRDAYAGESSPAVERETAVVARAVETVGSAVGHQLAYQGFWCVLAGGLLILAYITVRFELRFAVAAVAALTHDVLVTMAIFSIFNWEFNLPIIAALLTIVGYSLNDTIVVFDRIRENYSSAILNLRDVINNSINQSLSRTVITSATTFFVVAVMLVFGGEILRLFVAALCIGVVVGTYSSIFVAAPVLLAWKSKKRGDKKAA